MKANKFFAVALAALAMVACKPNGQEPTPNPNPNPNPGTSVTITPDKHEFKVGATVELTCSAEATWTVISNNSSVTLNVAAGEKAAKVIATAVKAGNASVIATVGTEQGYATLVVKEEGGGAAKVIECSELYPLFIDGVTLEANKSKVVANFGPDDVDQFFYYWENTYLAGDGSSSKNFYGNMEGYQALTVNTVGWSGAGVCLVNDNGSNIAALNKLINDIKANPDQYFFHIALKSTDAATHYFSMLGSDGCEVAFGPGKYDVANSQGIIVRTIDCFGDFPRTGAWKEFDVPMSSFASKLVPQVKGVNVFTCSSGSVQGTQLNMDAVYFYKK